MRVVGIKRFNFKAPDGNVINGLQFHLLADPIDAQNGVGYEVEKVFLSEAKLNKMGVTPALDDIVSPVYNKYGKVDRLDILK